MKRILIFSAVRMEARAIAGVLGLRWNARSGQWIDEKTRVNVTVQMVGVGAIALSDPNMRNEATAGAAPAVVILAGLAGGLDPDLQTGDVVGNGLPEAFQPALPIRRGKTHFAKKIISTPAEKAEIFRSTGALAVEMESTIVEHFANSTGARFMEVRGILDTAQEILPAELARLVDPFGKTKPPAVMAHLLRSPGSIGTLVQLQRRSRMVLDRVARVVAELVDHLERAE